MWQWNPFTTLNKKLDDLRRRLIQLSVDQARFDTDLKALTDAVTGLIAAIETWIGTHTADFTAEDQAVVDAAKQAQAEIAKLTGPAEG